MDHLQGDDGDFIVRTRKVLWREVARSGGLKEVARAHVNLPSEAVKALELESKGDIVAFNVRKNKDLTMTTSFESQPADSKWENDPQYILEQLLSRVIILKSRKDELVDRWEEGEIDAQEFTRKTQGIRDQLNALTENLRRIQSSQFRGFPVSTETIIESKTQYANSEFAAGLIDSEDLRGKIHSTKKRIDVLSFAYSKGLFNESEYNHEKEELESIFSFLTDSSVRAKDILSRVTE